MYMSRGCRDVHRGCTLSREKKSHKISQVQTTHYATNSRISHANLCVRVSCVTRKSRRRSESSTEKSPVAIVFIGETRPRYFVLRADMGRCRLTPLLKEVPNHFSSSLPGLPAGVLMS